MWPPAPAPRTSLPCSSSQGTRPDIPSDDNIISNGACDGEGNGDGAGDSDGDEDVNAYGAGDGDYGDGSI